MRVGVVVSTIGQSEAFGLLLESLAGQTHPAQEIIIVDQGRGGAVTEQIALWQDRLPIVRLTSERGVSLGRNTGWLALGECDIVAFPDDDCTYGPTAFADVVEEFADPTIAAISGRLVGPEGRLAFGGERCDIDRRTVWTKAIEATTFYRLRTLEATGGFDVTLGIGSPTRWQSGEGTDLLLRVMDSGARVTYVPSIVITEHQRETTYVEYLRKVRMYGRGTGRVYRTRYNAAGRAMVIAKPLAAVVVNILLGRRSEWEKKWQAVLGRAEGMTQYGRNR